MCFAGHLDEILIVNCNSFRSPNITLSDCSDLGREVSSCYHTNTNKQVLNLQKLWKCEVEGQDPMILRVQGVLQPNLYFWKIGHGRSQVDLRSSLLGLGLERGSWKERLRRWWLLYWLLYSKEYAKESSKESSEEFSEELSKEFSKNALSWSLVWSLGSCLLCEYLQDDLEFLQCLEWQARHSHYLCRC